MALKVYCNTDSQDLPLNSSGVDWVEFSEGNDIFIFTAGNATIADGQDIPSQAELISAGIELTGSEIILDTYLLQDTNVNLLKSINGMGNLDKRYILAFEFDAVTASEPTFEAWDSSSLNTINSVMLGSGTASASFIRGKTTTSGSAGVGWVTTGTKMAGGSSGNFLFLNDENGFLASPTTLYATLAVVIPASQVTGFSANPVFVTKWLEN